MLGGECWVEVEAGLGEGLQGFRTALFGAGCGNRSGSSSTSTTRTGRKVPRGKKKYRNGLQDPLLIAVQTQVSSNYGANVET